MLQFSTSRTAEFSGDDTTCASDIFPHPCRLANGRRKIGYARARSDLANSSRGITALDLIDNSQELQPRYNNGGKQPDFIDILIKNNKDLWDRFINHPFCVKMGNGSARLEGFKNYMVQDFIFLRYTVQFTLGCYSKTDDWTALSMEAPASLQEAIDMANDQLKACTHDLGIPEAKLVAAEPRPKVKEYMEFQRKALVSESWLSLNILEAPCIIGYFEIASKLSANPSTNKETLFYNLWIKPNFQGTEDGVRRYRDFFNKNTRKMPPSSAEMAHWNDLFRKACELEIEFFNTGL